MCFNKSDRLAKHIAVRTPPADNPVVSWGSFVVLRQQGILILGRASRLDAFSGYHLPT